MALTETQKNKLDSLFASTNSDIPAVDTKAIAQKIVSQNKTTGFMADIKGIGTGIQEDINKRTEKVAGIQGSGVSPFRKLTQILGQSAGMLSNIVGQTAVGSVKALTPQAIQEPVGGAIKSGAEAIANLEPVQQLVQSYNNLPPEKQRDIDALLGFGSLGLDIAGAGVLGKGAKALTPAVRTLGKQSDEAFKTLKNVVGDNAITRDILPTKKGIIGTEINRALDLTQGDVNKIYQSTGNQVGDFIAERNLIGGNLDETIQKLTTHFDTNYNQVRQEISQVPTVYKQTSVPRYKQSLTEIQNVIKGKAGLEGVNKEINTLLKKKDLVLSDVQRVKELMDDHFNLYKVTGDVGAGASKEGLAKIRNELKTFIEKEVENNTGVDIKKINNEVSTSKTILNSIDDRITRGSTRATVSTGDIVTFLTGSGFGSPIGGLAAVLIKKIYQSPSFKLRFTRWLNKKSAQERAVILEQLQSGKVPKEIKVITKTT